VWDLVTAKIDGILTQITAFQNDFLQSFSPNTGISQLSPAVPLRQALLTKSPPSPLRQSGSLPAPLSSAPSPVDLRHRHINLSHSSNVLLPPVATRPKLESHVVALQLVVQIIESIATSQEGYANMSASHLRSLADGLESAYTFCHALLSKMVAEKLPLDTGFLLLYLSFLVASIPIFSLFPASVAHWHLGQRTRVSQLFAEKLFEFLFLLSQFETSIFRFSSYPSSFRTPFSRF
jgi:hypothetical protein